MFESNKDLVRRCINEIWNKGDLALINRVFASGYVFRHPNFPEPLSGPDGYKKFVKTYREAFPDMHVTINDMVAEGDMVVYRWTCAGTHSHELRTSSISAPATRRQVFWSGITMCTVRDGIIVDDLMYSDALGLRMQLGYVMERHEVPART